MVKKVTAIGRVDEDGRPRANNREAFLRDLIALAGHEVRITVELQTKRRSDRQNRWLHGVAIPLIAEECGYDRHEREWLRYYLLGLCFGTRKVEATGQDVPLVGGSSRLTTEQFSTFMEWLVRFGATELNIRIPLPDDDAWEAIAEAHEQEAA